MNPKTDREAPKGEQENTPWTSPHNASLPGCPSILLAIRLPLTDILNHIVGISPGLQQYVCRRGSASDDLGINLRSASASQNRKGAYPNLSI